MEIILNLLYNIIIIIARGEGDFLRKTQRGFLLTEAVIVITFISIVLFYLFWQFNNVFSVYEKSFHFNSVDGLYRTSEIKTFLLKTNFSELIQQLHEENIYIEFSDCSFSNATPFCEDLMAKLEVENAYFIYENMTSFINYVEHRQDYGELINYLDYIDYDRNYLGYRLIIEFSDGQFTSIVFL